MTKLVCIDNGCTYSSDVADLGFETVAGDRCMGRPASYSQLLCFRVMYVMLPEHISLVSRSDKVVKSRCHCFVFSICVRLVVTFSLRSRAFTIFAIMYLTGPTHSYAICGCQPGGSWSSRWEPSSLYGSRRGQSCCMARCICRRA